MKQGYDKEDLVARLFMALQVTRAGANIKRMELVDDKYVVIHFENGRKTVNVEGDSGIAIMKDVLKVL